MNLTRGQAAEFSAYEHSNEIPLKRSSAADLDPILRQKPLKTLRAIQSLKNIAQQTYHMQPTNVLKKPTRSDKDKLLTVLNQLNVKNSATSVVNVLSSKDTEALKIHNRIQYLQH